MTWRQLADAARGRDEVAFRHTSLLAAIVHNCAFGRTRDGVLGPEDFNPYAAAEAEAARKLRDEGIEVPFETLKIFLDPSLYGRR